MYVPKCVENDGDDSMMLFSSKLLQNEFATPPPATHNNPQTCSGVQRYGEY